jgi:hypothetical protein
MMSNAARHFCHEHAGCRMEGYPPQIPSWAGPNFQDDTALENLVETSDLDVEVPRDEWHAITPETPDGWRVGDWDERPVRFVDGSDKGDTVAWLRGPLGHPIPVRFSQIGSVVVEVIAGERFRTFDICEPVVSMVADAFEWDEVEAFAAELQDNGIRLLPAQKPDGVLSYDFETMRKAAQNRCNDEMGILEELAIAQQPHKVTVVDGRLEPRTGGFTPAESPLIGVIKSHREIYLHPGGLQLLYGLSAGQRTPVFRILKTRKKTETGIELKDINLPVASWYLKLAGGVGTMPTWGYVRVEVAWAWFEKRGFAAADSRMTSEGHHWVNFLSRALCEYRCRDNNYGRAAVSLDPIVRAEQLLAATFEAHHALVNRFYRITGL